MKAKVNSQDDAIGKFVVVPEFDNFEEFSAWMDNLKPEDYTHLIAKSKA